MSQNTERGSRSERGSALWGTGSRGGDRSSVLWGKGGRGALVTSIAIVALAAPLAAMASPARSSRSSRSRPQLPAAPAAPRCLRVDRRTHRTARPGLHSPWSTRRRTIRTLLSTSSSRARTASDGADKASQVALEAQQRRQRPADDQQDLKVVGAISLSLPAKWVEKLRAVPGLIDHAGLRREVLGHASALRHQLWPYESGNANLWPGDLTHVRRQDADDRDRRLRHPEAGRLRQPSARERQPLDDRQATLPTIRTRSTTCAVTARSSQALRRARRPTSPVRHRVLRWSRSRS